LEGLAKQGMTIWFIGCRGGREVDMLLGRVLGAKVKGIEQAPKLVEVSKTKLMKGSLNARPDDVHKTILPPPSFAFEYPIPLTSITLLQEAQRSLIPHPGL
jgi:hypothetical protein